MKMKPGGGMLLLAFSLLLSLAFCSGLHVESSLCKNSTQPLLDPAGKRALVTGAAGFIGSHVARHCADLGMQVVALDDLSGGFTENVPNGITFVVGDLQDDEFLFSVFEKYGPFDYVYHLAAYAAEGLSHFIRSFNYRNNLVASVQLLNHAIRTGTKVFVFTSSIAVYGTNQIPMTEATIPQPEDPYGIAKYAFEMDLKVAHEMFGIDYVIFRPHNVYGPNQNIYDRYRNVIGIFMYQIRTGQAMTIFGDGTQTRAFSHIDDVAPIISKSPLYRDAYGEVYNIGADQPYTLNKLADITAQEMGVEKNVIHLDPRNEVAHAVSDHTKVKCMFRPPPPTDLRTGIRSMVTWLKSHAMDFYPIEFENVELLRNMPPSWRTPTLIQNYRTKFGKWADNELDEMRKAQQQSGKTPKPLPTATSSSTTKSSSSSSLNAKGSTQKSVPSHPAFQPLSELTTSDTHTHTPEEKQPQKHVASEKEKENEQELSQTKSAQVQNDDPPHQDTPKAKVISSYPDTYGIPIGAPFKLPVVTSTYNQICFVVRTYRGHGDQSVLNLRSMLRSLQGLRHRNWVALAFTADPQPFPDLEPIVSSFSDPRMRAVTVPDKYRVPFNTATNAYAATDQAIKLCEEHAPESTWMVVTNGDNEYAAAAFDQLDPRYEFIGIGFRSRYFSWRRGLIQTTEYISCVDADQRCMRLTKDDICIKNGLSFGYTDLGAIVFRRDAFKALNASFSGLTLSCPSCQDAAMTHLMRSKNYTGMTVPSCSMDHSPTPASCWRRGGVWFDSPMFPEYGCVSQSDAIKMLQDRATDLELVSVSGAVTSFSEQGAMHTTDAPCMRYKPHFHGQTCREAYTDLKKRLDGEQKILEEIVRPNLEFYGLDSRIQDKVGVCKPNDMKCWYGI